MQIQVNGASVTVTDGITLKQLVNERGLIAERIVIEHNRSIIPAERWSEVKLADGDTLEIVSFVGGG